MRTRKTKASDKTRGTKLSRLQDVAIAALLTEQSHDDAARKAGVAPATLSRWLLLPEFQQAYRDAKRAVMSHAVGLLQGACGQAVQALVQNLQADKPGDRTRAAVAIISHALRGLELFELQQELEEVKAQLQQLTTSVVTPVQDPSDSISPTADAEDATEDYQSASSRPWLADPADDDHEG